jgi:hypothetical protein
MVYRQSKLPVIQFTTYKRLLTVQFREAHNLLQKSAHLLTNDIYLEEIADVLVEIMQLPKVTAWSSIRQHLQDYIGSPWFMTRLSESIRGE